MTAPLPGRLQSFWNEAAVTAPPRRLGDGERVDVAVVGGGLCGLTAALLLARAGRSVAVLEARRLGQQVTGHTTAKVTVQHGLIYADLMDTFGEAGARAYADANRAALDWIASAVRDRQIACDFERKPAFAYAERDDSLSRLERERDAARKLGLPVSLDRHTDLPFPVAAALRFDDQAQFHPIKYLNAILSELSERGCRLFEDTRVIDVDDGNTCRVTTETATLPAAEVIVATNLPILDRGGYFAKATPQRHIMLAARLAEGAPPLAGMYISVEAPSRSLRTATGAGGPLLIVVGEAFKPGRRDTAELTRSLEGWVTSRFAVRSVDYRWGNQDYFPIDRVPYVGRLLPNSRHVRIATGFQAWGMTNATAAAMMLADDILGRPNPWAETFRSTRIHVSAGGMRLLKENLDVAAHFVKGHTIGSAEGTPERLSPGDGGIVRVEGRAVAAYRDGDGRLHAVSPVCTHMGCHVHWNAAEQSWDCPCHGSRFDVDGKVLNGPTVRPLPPRA